MHLCVNEGRSGRGLFAHRQIVSGFGLCTEEDEAFFEVKHPTGDAKAFQPSIDSFIHPFGWLVVLVVVVKLRQRESNYIHTS